MKAFKDFSLKNYNSYKIHSVCREAYFPESIDDFITIYTENTDDIVLLGGGYNVILAKEYYDNSFVILNGNYNIVSVNTKENIITAQAGCSMLQLSELALKHSLSGLEIFYDIPSSLGGAVVMNAGASGEEIRDLIVDVDYLDRSDVQVKTIKNKDIGFHYRNSFFQRNSDKIVLSAKLKLEPGDAKQIKAKMELIKGQRWAKQPREYPNAGSVFKRPPGYYVGKLTEDLKLKGHIAGGAMLSKKHGGFIVNFNNASGSDILSIIDHVKMAVKDAHDVDMEIEQRIIS